MSHKYLSDFLYIKSCQKQYHMMKMNLNFSNLQLGIFTKGILSFLKQQGPFNHLR